MLSTLMRAAVAVLALIAAPAYADGPGDPGPNVAAPPTTPAPQAAPSADPAPAGRSGAISLDNGAMLLTVPEGYLFYPAPEAYAFAERNGAPPPSGTVFGLIARADADIRAPRTWATIVSYADIDYVPAQTASGLQDASFEADVAAARAEHGRAFEGFASAPEFDAGLVRLAWAERTAAPGSQGADLRVEHKLLGRWGVACLTSIGSADQMQAIAAAAPDLLAMLSFPMGSRHGDYAAATDRVSAYTVPGLVTGVPTPAAAAASDTGAAGQTAFGGLAGYFPWMALGIVVLAALGYLMTRRRRQDAPGHA